MGKYIDWYLVELEGRLQKTLRSDEVHDLVSQTAAHLSDSAAQLQESGMSEKDSELAAMERFGRISAISEEAIGNRAASTIGHRLMLAAFCVFVADLTWMRFGSGSTPVGHYTLWIAVGVLCVAAFFGRKVLWRELTVLSGFATVAVAIFLGTSFTAGSFMTRPEASQAATSIRGMLCHFPVEIERFERARWDFNRTSDATRVFYYPVGSRRYTPPIGDKEFIFAVKYESTNTRPTALQGWNQHGSLLDSLQVSQRELARAEKSLAAKAASTVFESFLDHFPLALVYGAAWLAGGLCLNLLFSFAPRIFMARSPVYRRFA
jgi:hypothetical protein